MKKHLNLLLIFLVIITTGPLTGCSTLNSLSGNNLATIADNQKSRTWKTNLQKLRALKSKQNWTLLARVGIASSQGSSSSQLDWMNQANDYKITLNNALTFGVVTISNNNDTINLDYQNQTYTAKTPEQLLYKLTKLKLPISQLEYWILGLPSPDYSISTIELNDYAYIKKLQQANYQIEYDNYELIADTALPDKVIIKTKGLYIKIMVQSWLV